LKQGPVLGPDNLDLLPLGPEPVESLSALRHVDEPFGLSSSALSSLPKGSGRKLMSSRSEPKDLQVERLEAEGHLYTTSIRSAYQILIIRATPMHV